MPDPDHLDRRGAVGVITLDNPPVNALSLSLRVALQDAFEAGLEDPEIEAFVIHSAGRMFSAGADIREFDSGAAGESPTLGELIAMIEASPKPVVAAVHGAAFGGGFELPLGCHARVSVPGTRVGLPEVTLGIVPGAGGTQRLPRLIGVPAALDAIVSGKPMKAEKGYELGLIDEMASSLDDLVDVAVRLAEKLAAEDGPPPKVRDLDDRLAEARENPGLFDDFRASIARRARGFEAPYACIECIEAAVEKPFDEGLAFERETFTRCRNSLQSKAQRHVFFAEREARRVRGVEKATPKASISQAAVLGCGTMGGGIAMCFANAGIPVRVTETEQGALDRGMDKIRGNYASTVSKGRLSEADAEARLALIEPTLDFDSIADADIVIEAVFEDMALKKEIFTRLDAICRPDAIMATNTSSLDVDEIAAVTSRPEQVVGLHFFSPANVMRLLEIVRGEKTSPEVLASVMAMSGRIGKVGIVVGVCDAFAANRMLYPLSLIHISEPTRPY